jgi:TrmH family RNA methyltransferase
MQSDEAAAGLRVVLVETRNPLNIGAVARAMSNFGFAELRLVKPYDVAFQEARSAVRSHYILERARVFESVAEAIADCSLVVGTTAAGPRDLHVPLYSLEPAGDLIRQAWAERSVALLFGSEKFGLSNEHMSHCHWLLRIPTRTEHGSMNLGQAVAICLYELRRSQNAEWPAYPPPAGLAAGDAERFTNLLVEMLGTAGYINPKTAESSVLKIRRLVLRMGLPAADAETWFGILRQILWKLKNGGASD